MIYVEEASFESSDEALWSSSGWGPPRRRLCGWDRKQTHGRGLCAGAAGQTGAEGR